MGRTRTRRGPSADARCPMLVGMVHLPALPGSPGHRLAMARIVDDACGAAVLLAQAGFSAVMVENYGDQPFFAEQVPPETTAAMAVIVAAVVRAVAVPVGVNVLRNDALAGLAVAAAAGARLIRVNVHSGVVATDQGLLTGRAAETVRRRAQLGAAVRIFADVHVKHAIPLSQPDLALAARDTAYRAGADGLIVSGQATGHACDPEQVRMVRHAVPDRPVWVGSGVTAENVAAFRNLADGFIVGTSLKRGGRTEAALDPQRVRRFIGAVQAAWRSG